MLYIWQYRYRAPRTGNNANARLYGIGPGSDFARDLQIEMMHNSGAGEECPLFTSRHAHHSSAWTISGFSVPKLCIACTMERLENRGELSVHLRKVLGEFRGLLGASGSSSLLDTLSLDRRVLEHLCNLLFGRPLESILQLQPPPIIFAAARRLQAIIFNGVIFPRSVDVSGCVSYSFVAGR